VLKLATADLRCSAGGRFCSGLTCERAKARQEPLLAKHLALSWLGHKATELDVYAQLFDGAAVFQRGWRSATIGPRSMPCSAGKALGDGLLVTFRRRAKQ
jgi:hypothetical protein